MDNEPATLTNGNVFYQNLTIKGFCVDNGG